MADVDNSLAGRITCCEPSSINAELKHPKADVIWGEHVIREVFLNPARGYVFGHAGSSTKKPNHEPRRPWVKQREWRGEGFGLEATAYGLEILDEVMEYIA